jgi:peptidase M23-like protein
MPALALLVLLASLATAAPARAAWRWPVHGEVRRPFAVRVDAPFAAGQHRGVDLAAEPGRAVRSACAGRVRFAGRVARSGGVVSVRCGGLLATYLELGSVAVRRGAAVGPGTRVGTAGAVAHVHLGARDARTGRYVDPLTLLARVGAGPSLGPAPDVAPPPARRAAPPPPRAAAPVRAAAPDGAPVLAWAGLALVAAALPLGGLVARHRLRTRTSWTSTSPARR